MSKKSEEKRTSNPSWIVTLLIGAIVWYGLYSYTKTSKAHAIQLSLQDQTKLALEQHSELSAVVVRVDGRDVTLTGSAPEGWQQKATTLVEQVKGVRILQNSIVIDQPVAPTRAEPPQTPKITAKLAPVPDQFKPVEQQPTPADLALKEAQKNLIPLDMGKIAFNSETGQLTERSHGPLNVVAKTMLDFPTIYLFVIGYADPGGDPTQNLDISTQRAQTVANYIIAKGVDRRRLAAQGFSDYIPVESDSITSEDQRIEFQLINGE